MAAPKGRSSRSRTHHRRSGWKATEPHLVPVPGMAVEGGAPGARRPPATRPSVPRRLHAAYQRGLVRLVAPDL
ncbi:50S ribosomal protein L32 [Pedococcus aerophilus]|uniref:50S ribosomal protein L32 n=1 Tax=Pedococcus aerophilus TaxID=436356 RepID=UPI0031DDB632